jgi:hypothetical protein
VLSALPYEGRVNARLKRTARLKLRLPEGVDAADVAVSINGSGAIATSAFTGADGLYLVFDRLSEGAEVEMTFPTPTATRDEMVADAAYAVTWKGNTVVDLAPVGQGYPVYRRDSWRQSTTPQAPWPYGVQTGRIRW